MTDETEPTTSESDQSDDRIEEATDLIGTEELWSGQILYTGVELGLFEMLENAPSAARDLAAELDLDTDNTYRLLRAMAHFGVLKEDEHRRFSLTPVGELFQADHPDSVRSDLLFNRSREWMLSMLHMPEIVRDDGPSGFVREFGCDFFEYVQENPEFGDRYTELMEVASRDQPRQILKALKPYDLSQFSHICDVGGGRGHLLCHILQAYPHLEGTVLDVPSVVADEQQRWAPALNVADRCSYLGGDMFEEVPEADAYILKWILHNFSDEECLQILSTIDEAAPSNRRLFIIETVLPGPGTSHDAKRLDIAMMVQTGGRERTKAEYARLLERAEWELVETWVPEEGSMSILVAK